MEVEESAARGLGSDEENQVSQSKSQDQDSNANQLCRRPASSPCENNGIEEWTTDPRNETSSGTMYEHELNYNEDVPEEPVSAVQEVEAEKAGGEDKEYKGEAPGEKKRPVIKNMEEKEPLETAKKKEQEDDDGELDDEETDDDDLEEGEVREPGDKKVRPRPICPYFIKDVVPPLSTLSAPVSNSLPFRGQVKGDCTWGMNCRFLHPGVNDKGNYSLISKADHFLPNSDQPLGPHPLVPASPCGGQLVDEILPPPLPKSPTERAWERGLRHAKEVLKKATIRKKQDPDFEEKRLTVTIGDDKREFEWNDQITRDVRETALETHSNLYCDYDIERCCRGEQYENFRVQDTETEPFPNYRERERQRERENRQREREKKRERDRERWQREREHKREREKDLQRRKEEWEREKAKWDNKYRQHRDPNREKEPEKDKEKPKSRLAQPPSRQAQSSKKKTTTAGPQVKGTEEWKDPWRRSKSPKKKLGLLVSPSPAQRSGKTSALSVSASSSSGSCSCSSSCSGSGLSRSPSKSSSYSSSSSRSSRYSSSSGSRSKSQSFSSSGSGWPTPSPHRSPVETNGELAPTPGKAGGKLVTKPAPPPAPAPSTSTLAPAPRYAKPGEPPEARRKEQPARSPPRKRSRSGSGSGRSSCRSHSGSSSRSRSISVSSVSLVSSTMHRVDSEDRYRDLASPMSSASSRSPSAAQAKKDKGKSKKSLGVTGDKWKRDFSTQVPKTRNLQAVSSRSCQQPSAPQQAPPGQPPQGSKIAHKEIKLTLLNKVTEKGSTKRLKLSDKDRQSPRPAKRVNTSSSRGSQAQKSGGRLGSSKPEQQRGQNPRPSLAQPDKKPQLSSQSKSSSKVTIVPGKAADGSTASAPGTKSGKASGLSRREELLKQLKAVEDAIAQKRARILGKV